MSGAGGLGSDLGVLLQQHLVQDGHEPVFKLTVVVIGHQKIPDSAERGQRT